ncbi:MAG: CocE/NonD family hydrolase [Candidatus Hydrogenedentes bacterium]|nr:CocE/NonD family hydrolase [Candidatus Hydrogenedentota bacterium]
MSRFFVRGLLIACIALLVRVAAEPRHVRVPMQDGTELATDVYTPDGEGPWPVVLLRSTYGRSGQVADEWLEQGYAVVIQDVRGMGDSAGEAHVFYADGWREGLADGAATVAWIGAQPWCNGKIGTHGGSALAITQMLLAPSTGGVVVQNMVATPSNLYADVAYTGGVLRKRMIEGWLTAIKQPHIIDVYKSHPRYDDYWAHFDTVSKAGDITAPALLVNGWYDIFQQGTIDGFVARQERGGEGARGGNFLIMTPGSHGPDIERDYKMNPNRFDVKASQIRNRIFAHYLKGDSDALAGIPAVHYYVMGADTPGAPGNEWRTADAWPPYPTTPTSYYLHPEGKLAAAPPGTEPEPLSYVFDPANPVPTHGGANLLMESGAFDQRKNLEGRQDVLRFRTEPRETPLEITGRVAVRLHVSSNAPDTDFTAMLLDIYPEGDARELNIIDNVRRVKTRSSYREAAPLLQGPEEIVELEIDLWSAAWIFDKGHRIGLNISSSNYPRFEVNPNTGEDFPKDELRKATNTVHISAAHPGALILPVR